MPIARISRLTVEGYLPAGKRARISRLSVDGTAAAGTTKRARISRLGLVGNQSSYRARISRLAFVGAQVIPLIPVLTASALKVEPGTTVTVSTAGTTGNQVDVAFTTPTAGVVLTGTGPSRTFVAPREWAGQTVDVQATFTDSFGATADRTISVTVYPQQFWFLDANSVLRAVRSPFRRI